MGVCGSVLPWTVAVLPWMMFMGSDGDGSRVMAMDGSGGDGWTKRGKVERWRKREESYGGVGFRSIVFERWMKERGGREKNIQEFPPKFPIQDSLVWNFRPSSSSRDISTLESTNMMLVTPTVTDMKFPLTSTRCTFSWYPVKYLFVYSTPNVKHISWMYSF